MPVLGLDTSCYTSSCAVVDGTRLIADRRKLLNVPQGGRGLRQSDALFQHVQNLPVLMDGLRPDLTKIQAVCISARPRTAEGSYMPVFTAGLAVGKAVAAALGVPCFETSHQEGHIAAGLFSLGYSPANPFLAFHISGGTTEVLKATPTSVGFDIEILGATEDLHAGQVVDRVGVALGLGFPAGPELEKLAARYAGKPGETRIPSHVNGANCSLSGTESAIQRLIAAGTDYSALAYELLRTLADVFSRMAWSAAEQSGMRELLVIGGVASNELIRTQMRDALERRGLSVLFAERPFSSDNAVGAAYLGQQILDRGV